MKDYLNAETKTGIDEQHIAIILRETVKGLAYLHSQKKIHRDVKGMYDKKYMQMVIILIHANIFVLYLCAFFLVIVCLICGFAKKKKTIKKHTFVLVFVSLMFIFSG